ncbi:hypothetical protein ACSDR0_36140 [Streptosporangium sp. G11]|uniref:hypothetical protein n=1 Tax=Streptosporangium sp. G11 TaxID=3436926 RepID=UPI003EB9A980
MKRSTIAVIVAACVWGGVLLVPVAFFALNYGCDAGDDYEVFVSTSAAGLSWWC